MKAQRVEMEAARWGKCKRNYKLDSTRPVCDGCMQYEEDGSNSKMQCMACGCHRNFHKPRYEIRRRSESMQDQGPPNSMLQQAPPALKKKPKPPKYPLPDPDDKSGIQKLIHIPDSDFTDFDLSRSESRIKEGDIWALYHHIDEMPKLYCRVNKIIRNPFKAKINWLDPFKGPENPPPACGDFRVQKTHYNMTLDVFSHPVHITWSREGRLGIYPMAGQIWALYKPLLITGPGISSLEAGKEEQNTPFDMVEVITDFNRESGVLVRMLDMLPGFKSLFQKSPAEAMVLGFEQLTRFSHRVPARCMTGNENPRVPVGAWELDPAAM